jgi:hypothetical protein
MGRMHVQPFPRQRIGPAVEKAPAGKDQRMRTLLVDDGEFEIAVEGGARYRLPHSNILHRRGCETLR